MDDALRAGCVASPLLGPVAMDRGNHWNPSQLDRTINGMKRVLVVHYSQSGQLTAVLRSIVAPLENRPDIEVVYENIEPVQDYPFPWPFFDFLDVFPESVYLDPAPIKPLKVDPESRFDLIILGYTVWYLSPSQPVTAFLKSAAGRRLLAGTPVITVTACRNMWLTAQEKVKKLLTEAGARHLDHVALIDQSPALATFYTTPRWLLTGRKDTVWNFPPAGIAESEIAAARRFGRAIAAAFDRGDLAAQAPLLRGLEAVKVDDRLIASERIGHRSFLVWGRLLRKVGPPGSARRRPVLAVYVVFLIAMIVVVVPPSMLLRALLRPFTRARTAALKAAYEQPSGAESFRMQEFADDR